MLTPELEQLIQYALADGVLTPKERAVLMKKAEAAGVDLDEFEMILEAKLHEAKKAAAAAAPKASNKEGEVKKCPHCGSPVSSFRTTCQECGHEFRNVEAIKSAAVLFEQIQNLEMEKARELALHENNKNKQLEALAKIQVNARGEDSRKRKKERDDLIWNLNKAAKAIEKKFNEAKASLIKLYAVPNTKEDLLEILSMAAAAAYDNDGVVGEEEEVWLQKTDQIYQKLLILASDDPTTINQGTRMIASLVKRLPQKYKQFTRIPKEQYDNISQELKLQAKERKIAIRKKTLSYVLGWRGLVMILLFVPGAFVALVVTIVFIDDDWAIIPGFIFAGPFLVAASIGAFKMYTMCINKAEEEADNDLLS
jgi:hypothetical protein